VAGAPATAAHPAGGRIMGAGNAIEKKPARPELGYRPADALQHKVNDGDSWFTLATRSEVVSKGMSALDLCFYNFRTRDPAEINWYLYHQVGCRKRTADGRNYIFSKDDRPGVVYLPDPLSGGLCEEAPDCPPGSRKAAMVDQRSTCWFKIADNSAADGSKPLVELSSFSAVNRHSATIARVARDTGVDARLISAIMYMETTHGYYDAPLSAIGRNKSILPMNINVAYWGNTFGSRSDLEKAEPNIRAGAEMLLRIRAHLPPDAPVSHVATLYNNINATRVNHYGARVQALYDTQPWDTEGAGQDGGAEPH
jgi:hypothetical protein